MKKLLILTLFLNTAFVPQAKAVSEAALLFLLIQPSLRANGMGGPSVASAGHDALSVAFNPAHVGLASMSNSINFEFYPSKTKLLPQFNLDDLWYDAKSVNVGYNFKRINENIPISIGFGYTKIRINLGTQTITDETGPDPIATFESWENVTIWSVGLGFDYFLKAGIGLNFKEAESQLAPVGQFRGFAKESMHDIGLIVQLPIIAGLTKISGKSYEILSNVRPFFMPGFGFSKSNIGDKVVYFDAAQADPLPRVARMGFSINTGFIYSKDDIDLSLISLEWSSEAQDLLVKRDETGESIYESGLGKINFFDNVLKGNATEDIETRRGWELTILEILSIRNGRFEDPAGNVFYDASGFGISLAGILKGLNLLNPEFKSNTILNFLSHHLDVQYNSSSFAVGPNHVLSNTKFHGLRISFF